MIGIYQILNLSTNKFYIGSSVDIRQRWRMHRFHLNKGIHDNNLLQNAWNKYGEKEFVFNIVLIVDDASMLLKCEQNWLDWTKCYERAIGYNLNRITSGGGVKWSEESKLRFSEKKKGSKHSPETRAKMSATRKANGAAHSAKLKGRKQSDEHILAKAMGNRKRDKWPCAYGRKCKCDKCGETRRLDQIEYRKKLRDESGW